VALDKRKARSDMDALAEGRADEGEEKAREDYLDATYKKGLKDGRKGCGWWVMTCGCLLTAAYLIALAMWYY
jgi:hypothetical protein